MHLSDQVAGLTGRARMLAGSARSRAGAALGSLDARLRPDLQPGWTGADLPDQTGRTWLITGATNGIGREAARAVAAAGGRVLVAARNVERGEALLAELGGNGRVIRCDLADPASVREAAAQVDEPVDVLVDNAGVFATRRVQAPGGHEQMWQTNVLGPFAFTNLVLRRVRDRVVITGSDAHRSGRIDLADPDFTRRRFTPWSGYAQSKLAGMVWAHELDRRLRERGARAVVQVGQPGWAATNLQRNQSITYPEPVYRAVEAVATIGAQSAEAGSWPLLYAGTAALPGLSYVSPTGWMRGHPVTKPFAERATFPETGQQLWEALVAETGTDLPADLPTVETGVETGVATGV